MSLLAVKILLAPSFVVGASLVARRYGPLAGGLLAGLPVVAGPILLAYALEHGRPFAANAAAGTLLGLVSLIAFVVLYTRLARRLAWVTSMLAGWLVFAAATALFSSLSIPLGAALALAALAVAVGLAALPRPGQSTGEHPAPPSWDLPLRALCALALVLSLTAIAGWLGPRLSGLLAPFPIIATVLATFTHAQRGRDELARMMRGMLSGFTAFALFFFTLALALRHLGTAASFALATALAVTVQLALYRFMRSRRSAVAPAGALLVRRGG